LQTGLACTKEFLNDAFILTILESASPVKRLLHIVSSGRSSTEPALRWYPSCFLFGTLFWNGQGG